MREKLVSISFVFLVIVSAIAIFVPKTVSATAPTITVYGISPANAPVGTYIKCWLTYTDADNDAPTYVRCERSYLPNINGLQPPVNTMVANNTGDTTYTDGKQYYFNWYYFPFVGVGFVFFMVKSGADTQVNKFVPEYQEPTPVLKNSGMTPKNNTPGNYTFFTNYSDVFNGIPNYVQIVIDGTTHSMNKNNSSQTTWITGVDYSYIENLDVGNHTYSFQALSTYGISGKQINGNYWIMIQNQTIPTDWNFVGIGIIIIGLISVIIGIVIFVKKK